MHLKLEVFPAAIYIIWTTLSLMGKIKCAPFRGGYEKLNQLMLYKSRNKDCNVTLSSSNGTITSPRYPSNYPENSDCWFHLKTSNINDRMQLEFEEFALEHSAGCTFDYLEIFDGPTTAADVLGKFCIEKPVNRIESSSDQLLLHFRSDYLVNNKGFRITFSTVINTDALVISEKPISMHSCPKEGKTSSGFVTSPGYPSQYPPNTNCTTILTTAFNQRYVINFQDMDIEYDELCLFDYVEIRDGPNQDSPQLAQICGKTIADETFTTSGNSVFIQFISDGFVEFRGFKLSYQSINEPLEYEAEDEDEGEDEEAEGIDRWIESPEEGETVSTDNHISPSLVFAQPFNASLTKGQAKTMNCLINGSNSAIVWLKDHSFFTTTNEDDVGIQLLANNSLQIAYMTEELEGIYTCVVLSEHGAFSINFWITMETGHTDDHNDCGIDVFQKPKDTMVNEGENTYFTCFANTVAGIVNITWLKDGDIIRTSNNNSDRIQILMENVMLINRTTRNDSGVYTCHAKDVAGCVREVDAYLTVDHHTPVSHINNKNICGKPKIVVNNTRSGKVVAGRVVTKGSFPWQAMLWETMAGQFCGGSLIHPRWVITAAHCFTEFQQQFSRQITPDHLSIKFGKHDRSRPESDEQMLSVDKIISHPEFNKLTYDSDIALVQLAQPVHYTNAVLPVCLFDSKFAKDEFYEVESAGIIGSVTGWGSVTERGLPSVLLQEIRLPLVNFNTCANSTSYPVTKNMFCAGYTHRVMGDACHGDSGGPYTVLYEGQWYLLGIVSWGEGCDREGKFGFYTKVANYAQWIFSSIESEQH